MLRGEALRSPTYSILRSIQGGRAGLVHLSEHAVFGRRCVQKTVDLHGLADAVALQEPRLLDAIEHPRITPVSEAQFDPDIDGAVTFVMPYYEGGSVYDAITGDGLSLIQSLRITRDALDGLAYLHDALSYVHRDVKPGNIFLDRNREHGFLGDLGSAAVVSAGGSASALGGTPLYKAPEGLDAGKVGMPSDIYGVGLTLFEMLNGPFPYADIDPAQVDGRLARGQRSVPDRLLAFKPQIPTRVRRIVTKAISRDPARRFLSARQMIAATEAVRCIDWKRRSGRGPDGEWVGSGPPGRFPDSQLTYRVTSSALRAGSKAGQFRLVAQVRRAGSVEWRRFGIPDATVEPSDETAVAQFFAEVKASAARR